MTTKCVLRATSLGVCLAAALASGPLAAQSDQGIASRAWGIGQPQSARDLPPGQLRNKLESLPPQANARALKWLQDISFTGTDLEVLRIDDAGGVLFVDPVPGDLDEAAADAQAPITEEAPASTLDNAFFLHSNPGAPRTVFIDFDGHRISGTAWNGSGPDLDAVPYDIDGDPNTFNDAERTNIVDIWHRVAEDLAPFDIDVTTEEPAVFDRYTGHVLVTRDVDASGLNMPSKGAGGVAYVGVYGASYYADYSPALVYFNNLGGGASTYVAEASSHEFGHNLGLSHDGTKSGTTYYGGDGTGLVSWAPIMGNSYYNNVTQWSAGEYADANQLQDDLGIIEGKLGLRGDDHGDAIGSGTPLLIGGDGSVVSSNPEFDPDNLLPENKGVIDGRDDVDVFTFQAGAGALSLAVTPAWDAFYRATTRRGANLDVRAELRDAAGGIVVASDPSDDTQALVQATVAAGTHHLLVTGVGSVNYSDYDSLGQYFINGTVPVGVADVMPPSPDPMSFASLPQALGESAIAMAATPASDASGGVQYRFNCVSGGTGCAASAWQASPGYTATGLAADTQYTFTVQARDAYGNMTAASSPASARTDAPPPPPPYVDFTAAGDTPVAGTVSGAAAATQADDGLTQSIREVESGGKPSRRHSLLEHRWAFTITAGASATVFANAWSGGSSDGDAFRFEYSLNGGASWSPMFEVSSGDPATLESFLLPGTASGSVLLRVVDTNQDQGARNLDTVFVDHLYIQVANPPSDPPDGGAGDSLTAEAASASSILLTWSDGASNETGWEVERSVNGGSWSLAATLGANTDSWTNDGLAPSTGYDYRVRAVNPNGSSPWSSIAGATTPDAPPPPALSLGASGSKVKGVMIIDLSWSGADPVDVYRNGGLLAGNVPGGAFTDDTGQKGSGSFEHQVCVAGSTECSNVTITTF